ncbi:MAG: hypothetical protein HOV87_32920 [Catenulispora sp.]|nr:hypothetical protein [Catenulispora sp.]
MAADALHLSSAEASSGATMTITLPSGPVTAKIPPVRNGQVLKIQGPQGAQYVRVHVIPSPARRLMRVFAGLVLLVPAGLGPAVLISSAFAPRPNPNAVPICDGQSMGPSDRCQFSGDINVVYTYTEMQQREAQSQPSPGALAAGGSILTGVDVVVVAVYLVQRRLVRRHPVPVRAVPAVGSHA